MRATAAAALLAVAGEARRLAMVVVQEARVVAAREAATAAVEAARGWAVLPALAESQEEEALATVMSTPEEATISW